MVELIRAAHLEVKASPSCSPGGGDLSNVFTWWWGPLQGVHLVVGASLSCSHGGGAYPSCSYGGEGFSALFTWWLGLLRDARTQC